MREKKSIAIIGAGPGGLYTAAHLSQSVGDQFSITMYERYDRIGGQWNAREKTGIDEDGLPVHSAIYPDLQTNATKFLLSNTSFPIPDEYPLFMHHSLYQEYLQMFYDHFHLAKLTVFNSYIEHVAYDRSHKNFHVTVFNTNTRATHNKRYDYVIIASGRCAIPRIPTYEGQETFPGQIIHSKHFRDPSMFSDKRVLVVGTVSAIDIVNLVVLKAVDFKSISLMYRDDVNIMYMAAQGRWSWPGVHLKCSQIKRFQGSTVFFTDETSEEFDLVILGTGYEFKFPFVSKELRARGRYRDVLNDLYLMVIHRRFPNLFYVAADNFFLTGRKIQLQAKVIEQVLTGVLEIPTQEEMEADVDAREVYFSKLSVTAKGFFLAMTNYCVYLSQLTGDKHIFSKEVEGHILMQDLKAFTSDQKSFRELKWQEFEAFYADHGVSTDL